jgi:hypothetical protein
VQLVVPCKREALSSNPSTENKQTNRMKTGPEAGDERGRSPLPVLLQTPQVQAVCLQVCGPQEDLGELQTQTQLWAQLQPGASTPSPGVFDGLPMAMT